MPAISRRWRLRRASAAILVLGTVWAVVTFMFVSRNVANDQTQLLKQRASEATSVFQGLVGQMVTEFSAIGTVLSQFGSSRFAAVTAQVTGQGGLSGIALVDSSAPVRIVEQAGTLRTAPVLRSGALAPGIAGAIAHNAFQFVGIKGSGGVRTLGMAIPLSGDASGQVIYGELPVPTSAEIVRDAPATAFADLDFAIYLGADESPDRLLLADVAALPLRGTRAVVAIAPESQDPVAVEVGASAAPGAVHASPGDILLVLTPHGTLGGTLESLSPWLAAALALVTTLGLGAFLESAVRRRDHAVVHADRLQRALEAVEDAGRNIRHQAFHDPLTNLANRALFSERLEQALVRGRRTGARCAVLLLDLDDFKTLNDSLGHAAGDALLIEVAARLQGELRGADTAARLGGDEFAVLLEEASEESATATAQRLVEVLSSQYQVAGSTVVSSVSVGVAVIDADTTRAEDLLRNVDVAMYGAKAGGKGRYELYERTRHLQVREFHALQNDLVRALPNGELSLVYQPQIALASGAIVGVEALVRWTHPERGPIGPDVFIPLAERTGVIHEIDEWVLETACIQVQRWATSGLPPLRIAVNVSGRDLDDDDRLVCAVARTLETTGIRPGDVEIELTESVAVAQHQRALAILRRLRQLRVQVAIDDFGTGYSALSRLKDFPPDRIKIDRSFIASIGTPNQEALVAAMIAMGHSIGLCVLAEGVETEEQLRYLIAHGCDEVQGYLLSRPVTATALEQLLRTGGGFALTPVG